MIYWDVPNDLLRCTKWYTKWYTEMYQMIYWDVPNDLLRYTINVILYTELKPYSIDP